VSDQVKELAMRVIFVLALLLAGGSAPAFAEDDADSGLADKARAFVIDEAGVSDGEARDVMVECIVAALGVFNADEQARILAEDDFEDSLDAAVMMRPEIEDTVEDCLG
jgi:hypothetical protein